MDEAKAGRADRRVELWLLIASLATLAALAMAYVRENVLAEWRALRRHYRTILEARATDDLGRAEARQFRIRIEQHFLPDLDRVDRCTTCHAGVQDPRMADLEQPFATHPGRHLERHDPGKFGCSVCHEGQGRATETAAAHGIDDHWTRPLLGPRFMATTCTKCHDDAELFGPTGLLAETNAPAAALVRRGWELLHARGCLGCHVLDGKGGVIGPDLSHQGEKTAHELDFSHLPGEEARRAETWLLAHFVEPARVVPGTVMPAVSRDDAEALTAAMLSRRRTLASAVTTYRPARGPAEPVPGARLYATYCSACHGADGGGSAVAAVTAPTLNNVDFLAAADDRHLRAIVASGLAGTLMPAWGPGAGNLSPVEIDRIVAHLRSWEPRGASPSFVLTTAGDPARGAALYGTRCAACHGPDGGGELAPPLRPLREEPMALARAIIAGNPRAGMPSGRDLTGQEVADLIALLRAWATRPAPPAAPAPPPPAELVAMGRASFEANCAGCHGPTGRGAGDGADYVAPSLHNADFLAAASDGYLMATIVRGRRDTAMFAFGRGSGGPMELGSTEIRALVAFMRSWEERRESATGGAKPGI